MQYHGEFSDSMDVFMYFFVLPSSV